MIDRSKLDAADRAAKLARQIFAAEDGVKATQEAEREALAVRENMARLRELRLAREAEQAQEKQDAQGKHGAAARKRRTRRVRVIRVAP